jgi:DNA polymerase III alpha subunit
MDRALPLFKSHYSIGRSILTLDPDKEASTDSVVNICSDNDISELYLVEDNMNGFLEAYQSSVDAKINLRFGLRLSILDDCEDKSPDSLSKTCKYIIFAKNNNGYKKLIKIYTHASKHGFYYYPRIDFSSLREFWSEKDLLLCVPFYDSFIFRNTLEYSSCVPELDFVEPTFFVEDNNLPFDKMIADRVSAFCEGKYPIEKTKSIYYKNKQDFKSYLTFRCINNRTTLDKPNFDHMCSDEFCFESWKEQVA